MKIINDIEQGSEEWLEWRRGAVCASDLPALCGVCPYRTAYDVYLEKLDLSMQTENEWMKRGKNYEEEARIVFNSAKSHNFKPVLIEHDEFSHFRASLDGYCHFNREILEIKIPGRKALEMASTGRVPKNYIYQIQWQLFVSGSHKAHLFVYHPETMKSYTIGIEPDEAIREEIIAVATKFWEDFKNDIPPVEEDKIKHIEYARSADLMIDIFALEENKRAQNRIWDEQIKAKKQELFELELEGKSRSFESDFYVYNRSDVTTIEYKQACLDAKLDLSSYDKKSERWALKKRN